MEINEAFGLRLRQLRKAKGWSLLELSVRADVNHNYLSDIENGRRNPTLNVLHRLSSGFGISLSSLLLGIELMTE